MFRGKVISGDGIGKTLGYPTANLDTPREAVTLRTGVYAAYATCLGKKYRAALAIHEKPWKVEVHFIDYDGADCRGRVVEVEAKQKISEMEHFDSVKDLKNKICDDIELVKRILRS